jgi:hypothetical protein
MYNTLNYCDKNRIFILLCCIQYFENYTHNKSFVLCRKARYLLTYLSGTTTNIWLRTVQEDLSMTACLEHRTQPRFFLSLKNIIATAEIKIIR